MMKVLPRILLVDDDAAHRLLVRRALRAVPAHITEADSISRAREILRSEIQEIRLVLLDLNLGGIPGTIVLEEARKLRGREELPIVVLSTSALTSDVESAYRTGANCYLLKSTDPEELRRTLEGAALFFLSSPSYRTATR